jgi:CRISPR/Cas system-associated endoribonuclease Cas2
MSAYLVAYDLHQPGQKHKELKEHLESFGSRWHLQRSVWIVVTDESAEELTNSLLGYFDDNDKLLVLGLSKDSAWWGYNEKTENWLSSVL